MQSIKYTYINLGKVNVLVSVHVYIYICIYVYMYVNLYFTGKQGNEPESPIFYFNRKKRL